MFGFGSGVVLGFRTDIPNQTPINLGLVNDVTLDFSFDLKELFGQYQSPLAVARGKSKYSGKSKLARISGLSIGTLFWGITPVTGQQATSFAEVGTIPAPSGPYTITVANSATFTDDYGVVYANTGLPLSKVVSGPITGQYSVSGGVYTFAAADTGLPVFLNYGYTIAGTGQKIVVTNQLMGQTPTFQLQFYSIFQGKQISIKFPNVASSKLSFSTKLDDFTMPELDFTFYADAGNNLFTWSFAEVS